MKYTTLKPRTLNPLNKNNTMGTWVKLSDRKPEKNQWYQVKDDPNAKSVRQFWNGLGFIYEDDIYTHESFEALWYDEAVGESKPAIPEDVKGAASDYADSTIPSYINGKQRDGNEWQMRFDAFLAGAAHIQKQGDGSNEEWLQWFYGYVSKAIMENNNPNATHLIVAAAAVQLSRKLSPSIPSSIVRALDDLCERVQLYFDVKKDNPKNKNRGLSKALNHLAFSLERAKKELLSAQPAEQGEPVYKITPEIENKFLAEADTWNDEIKPHILKGLVKGFNMALKEFRRPSPVLITDVLVKALERIKTNCFNIGHAEEIAAKALSQFTTPQPDKKEEKK